MANPALATCKGFLPSLGTTADILLLLGPWSRSANAQLLAQALPYNLSLCSSTLRVISRGAILKVAARVVHSVAQQLAKRLRKARASPSLLAPLMQRTAHTRWQTWFRDSLSIWSSQCSNISCVGSRVRTAPLPTD